MSSLILVQISADLQPKKREPNGLIDFVSGSLGKCLTRSQLYMKSEKVKSEAEETKEE